MTVDQPESYGISSGTKKPRAEARGYKDWACLTGPFAHCGGNRGRDALSSSSIVHQMDVKGHTPGVYIHNFTVVL